MKETIKNYLEEQCKKDSALVDTYNVDYIDGCIEYITKMAKEELNGKNGAIKDEVVFHWAREYFVDGIALEEKKERVKKNIEKNFSLNKVKVNKNISEESREHMKAVLRQVRAEQQEFDF